mgnify:CR=1 FL=1
MYRVMLADDEPIMRTAMLTLPNWKEMDCEIVYVAANGQEVLDQLEELKPDILITDIKMPGKDGVEVAEYICENQLGIKVIMLTAYADFSYAQKAIKYGVLDYVTKTGAFDGLMNAIEKAKNLIQKERQQTDVSHSQKDMENLLKSVFDGSMYDESEIQESWNRMLSGIDSYALMMLCFRIDTSADTQRRHRIYNSLKNFFKMAFGEDMVCAVRMYRDTFVLLLRGNVFEDRKVLEEKCMQVIDMMDNFMQMETYLGVGECQKNPLDLKKAYEQVNDTLQDFFADSKKKINFYDSIYTERGRYLPESEEIIRNIEKAIRKGDKKQAMEVFRELLRLQVEYHYSVDNIKNSGIIIQNNCRKILAEYEKSIYDILKDPADISKRIYSCHFLESYEEVMSGVIESTAEFISQTANKKNSLIYDCQCYIDQHYKEYITVAGIAESIGTSPSYLSRIFKETTGRTIIYTINQKKIEQAKEYLQHTDMKIYEIADALGFENVTYFSHFFKKHTGISPKDYK